MYVRTDVGSIRGPGKGAGRGRQREGGGVEGRSSRDGREGKPPRRDIERDASPGDCCAVATSLDVEANRVRSVGETVSLSLVLVVSLPSAFHLYPRSPFPPLVGSPALSRLAVIAVLVDPPPNRPSRFRPRFAISPSHTAPFPPRDSLPSLTLRLPLSIRLALSLRSSAKTSIRLSPVAPRYTDPTRASRRAPRVPTSNVDPTSLSLSLASPSYTTTSYMGVARHVLPVT